MLEGGEAGRDAVEKIAEQSFEICFGVRTWQVAQASKRATMPVSDADQYPQADFTISP